MKYFLNKNDSILHIVRGKTFYKKICIKIIFNIQYVINKLTNTPCSNQAELREIILILLINSVRQGMISNDRTNWQASRLIVSSSLHESLEGSETVTDVAKCRNRVVSKMNLTFNVYMRLANCAPWERARQTRRRELNAIPRIYALISGVYTNMHLGFYILRRRGIVAVSTTKFHSHNEET